jgi:hypothetical protein
VGDSVAERSSRRDWTQKAHGGCIGACHDDGSRDDWDWRRLALGLYCERTSVVIMYHNGSTRVSRSIRATLQGLPR